jgi:hypothetical protein
MCRRAPRPAARSGAAHYRVLTFSRRGQLSIWCPTSMSASIEARSNLRSCSSRDGPIQGICTVFAAKPRGCWTIGVQLAASRRTKWSPICDAIQLSRMSREYVWLARWTGVAVGLFLVGCLIIGLAISSSGILQPTVGPIHQRKPAGDRSPSVHSRSGGRGGCDATRPRVCRKSRRIRLRSGAPTGP